MARARIKNEPLDRISRCGCSHTAERHYGYAGGCIECRCEKFGRAALMAEQQQDCRHVYGIVTDGHAEYQGCVNCGLNELEGRIKAAAELHQRSTWRAGERENGMCAYCQGTPELPLLGRVRDYLNDSKRKVWLHEHADPYPHCVTCADGYDGRADWPCATAVALGVSLVCELQERSEAR